MEDSVAHSRLASLRVRLAHEVHRQDRSSLAAVSIKSAGYSQHTYSVHRLLELVLGASV